MSKDINVLIRNLPQETDKLLNALATLRGKTKWEVIREALIEYGEKHRSDINKLVRARATDGT